MRIIAGRYKGRVLRGPARLPIRPTSDGLRETLFNVIGDRVEEARVLDLYAGTGGVGLEALSRGARHVTFVEQDARVIRLIEQNVATFGVQSLVTLVRADAARGERLAGLGLGEIVFADPPYDVEGLDGVVVTLSGLTAPGGLAVLEFSRRRDVPVSVPGLTRTRVLVAGDSALAFYTSPASF